MKNRFMKALLFISFVGLLSACTGQGAKEKSTSGEGQRQLTAFTVPAEGRIPGAFLTLVDAVKTDSSTVYTAKSVADKDTVGLKIEVINGLNAGIFLDGTVNNERGFHKGGVKISSLGKESDHYVRALAKLYGLTSSGQFSSKTLLPLTFSSNKKNLDLSSKETYSFKLFLANKLGDEAEAFAVLDLYRNLFEITARDSSQYARIISALQD